MTTASAGLALRCLILRGVTPPHPLSVTVLGSGTAVPEPDRFPAGYLVRGGGEIVLVDCGPGVLRRLAQAPHFDRR